MIALSLTVATAQAPPAASVAQPTFEVASVKSHGSIPGERRLVFLPNGRFLADNLPLRSLIATAYGDPRALLAERFGLVVRQERRPIPVYALTLARRDGRTGPALRPATGEDCVPAPPPGTGPSTDAAAGDAPVVSIFTAVQEQLGLRLEPSTSDMDVIVIERVERPSQN
jgi:hypothetical protein